MLTLMMLIYSLQELIVPYSEEYEKTSGRVLFNFLFEFFWLSLKNSR